MSSVDSVNGIRISIGRPSDSVVFECKYSTKRREWCSKIGMNWRRMSKWKLGVSTLR
jgi:hypothetical protein